MSQDGVEPGYEFGATYRKYAVSHSRSTDQGGIVRQPFIRAYRGLHDLPIMRQRRARFSHDRGLIDPRVATEHRIAHQRALDAGGTGCTFCG
jgi:hypothetical protein